MEKYDVAVIGGGPAGYPAAIRAAQLGAKVALIEKEYLGGTCLNWGCIPTKSLIASSTLFQRIKNAADLGLSVQKPSFDYSTLAERKDKVVAKLRGGVAQLMKANGVTVFAGEASFLSRNRLNIESSDKATQLEAGKIIIAAGSESVVPKNLADIKQVVDSRRFLALSELPETLIILGAGVIGCEFACLCAQLGVKVTLVELMDDVTPFLDRDIRVELRSAMTKELGINVLTGKPLENIKSTGKTVSGKVGTDSIKADMLLCAIGRKPVTGKLNLAAAGVKTDGKGYIQANTFCETDAASVYAAGDVRGGQLAHEATSQGIAAAENACGLRSEWKNKVVPACIFTEPEIGVAGLSEEQAAENGIKIKTGKFTFSSLGKALASGDARGFAKWIADEQTGRLLGAQVVGAHATELIAEATLAIESEQTSEELGSVIHAHPTMSEVWMEAAHAVDGVCINAAPSKKRH